MIADRARIVVVGSANVDLTSLIDRLPEPGETIFGERFDLGFGGKGANQEVAAALCGAEAHMVARLGEDLFGPATIENFKTSDVGSRHVKLVPGLSSGVAPIFVDAAGQNRIIVIKGANDELTPAAVEQAASLLESADVIVLQFEIPLETVYYTVRFARERGIRCILNPAPAAPVQLQEIAAVDYLIPNETEAESLTGMPVQTADEASACARRLLDQGFRRVVLTLGERGALLATPQGSEFIAAFPVEARDTSGAGDALIGSFAVFVAEGLDDRDALARANLYAAMSTTGVGTQKAFVDRDRFQKEWLRRRP